MGKSASYPRSEETKNRMSLAQESKSAQIRGITVEEYRQIKIDAINDWKVNGMSIIEVANKYNFEKSKLYDWHRKLKLKK